MLVRLQSVRLCVCVFVCGHARRSNEAKSVAVKKQHTCVVGVPSGTVVYAAVPAAAHKGRAAAATGEDNNV